jgi:hypothetical protein
MPGVATVVADRWRRHHEVSILIAAGGGEGRCLGSHPRAKVSMTIMRPPQHGQRCGSTRGSSIAALGGSLCFAGACHQRFDRVAEMPWYPGKQYHGIIGRAQAELRARS